MHYVLMTDGEIAHNCNSIGTLDDETLLAANRSLAIYLGLA